MMQLNNLQLIYVAQILVYLYLYKCLVLIHPRLLPYNEVLSLILLEQMTILNLLENLLHLYL